MYIYLNKESQLKLFSTLFSTTNKHCYKLLNTGFILTPTLMLKKMAYAWACIQICVPLQNIKKKPLVDRIILFLLQLIIWKTLTEWRQSPNWWLRKKICFNPVTLKRKWHETSPYMFHNLSSKNEIGIFRLIK